MVGAVLAVFCPSLSWSEACNFAYGDKSSEACDFAYGDASLLALSPSSARLCCGLKHVILLMVTFRLKHVILLMGTLRCRGLKYVMLLMGTLHLKHVISLMETLRCRRLHRLHCLRPVFVVF